MTYYRDDLPALWTTKRGRVHTPYKHKLRLHRLEQPMPWGGALRAAVAEKLLYCSMNHYPDYSAFRKKLLDFEGMPAPENLVLGAGIEDLVRSIFVTACKPGDCVAMLVPTCAMYGVYADVFGVKVLPIRTDDPTFGLDTIRESIRVHISAGGTPPRVLFLPNPGQPFETYLGTEDVNALCAWLATMGCLLVVDEAYMGFSIRAKPLKSPRVRKSNIVYLRTFSKAFGAPSIRVGFAAGSYEAIKPLESARQSAEIAGPSMAVAEVLMDRYDEFVQPRIDAICEGRDWLRGFDAPGIRSTRGSFANHVLIEFVTEGWAQQTQEKLWRRGVLCKKPFGRHMLVAAGDVETMVAFRDELIQVLADVRGVQVPA